MRTDRRLILAHGRVRTLDPGRPAAPAEAVGLAGDRIAAVGSLAEVRAVCGGPSTRELDLHGATVVPGLVDAHGHLQLLGERMGQLDLTGASSADAVAAQVAAAAARLRASGASGASGAGPGGGGGWILGGGWDQNRFESARYPDRRALDAVAREVPVFLERVDGHAAWVNTAALERAGLGGVGVNDPRGGRLLRREDGSPSGVLLDAAMDAVRARIPPPSGAELEAVLAAAAARCAAMGLTQVHDAGVDLDVYDALEVLRGRGSLPVRVYAMERWGEPRYEEALARGPRGPQFSDLLALCSVKIFVDGALGSRGAALFEAYDDEPGNRGLVTGPQDLDAEVRRLSALGFQPALHAIGDRANALALDAFERARPAAQGFARRPRLEHAQVLRREDLGRLAPAGVVASMQPSHATSDWRWVERRLGARRARLAYAWRAVLEAGAQLAFGSDFPIEDPNPLWGVVAACTRRDRDGAPQGGWTPEQRLSRTEALAGFTAGAAWAAFEEAYAGRIAVGWRADLSAFDRDPAAAPEEELLAARARLTVVGGEIVFAADG